MQLRRDWLSPVGLYHTEARQRLSTTREDRVGQTMASSYGQNVTSNNPMNSGDGVDGMVSLKFGAVLGPWSGTEFYVKAGMGFHSNDARGAAIRVNPISGEPADRVTPLVCARGAGVGVAPCASPACNQPSRFGISASIQSCSSLAMPERPKRDAPAAAFASSGQATRA